MGIVHPPIILSSHFDKTNENVALLENFGCTCGQISGKEPPELRLLIDSVHEDFFVGVFESKVEGLRGEVPHHVDHIATPETQETLLFLNTTERQNSVQIINCPRFLPF